MRYLFFGTVIAVAASLSVTSSAPAAGLASTTIQGRAANYATSDNDPAAARSSVTSDRVWTEDKNHLPGDVQPLVTWAACGAFDSNTKVVRAFSRAATSGVSPYMGSGTSNLACGSDAWGYRHIVGNHLSQWKYRASQARENWRDTADYGIEWALKDPDRVRYRSSNDTYCFSRLIYLVNKSNGKVVDTYYPNVVVARGTKNIITAYPSGSQCT